MSPEEAVETPAPEPEKPLFARVPQSTHQSIKRAAVERYTTVRQLLIVWAQELEAQEKLRCVNGRRAFLMPPAKPPKGAA